jgi:CBS domain containing-hemolysin-like protein
LDPSGSPWGWFLLAALLILSAFFSGSETALLAANRLRLRQQRDAGDPRAARVLRLLEDPGRVLTALLVGNNLVNIAASVLAASLFVDLLGIRRGPWAAMAMMAVVLLIVSEITPKTFAAKHADRLSLWVSRPVAGLTAVLAPVIRALSVVSNLLVRPLGGRVDLTSPLVTEEEIRLLLKLGEEEGVIEKDERQMIHSIFEFGDKVVREVMVPRIDMVCVEDTTPLEGVVRVIIEEGHSRIPVYHETIDQIVGVVHVKDLLSHLRAGHDALPVREVMRPAFFVPESKRLDDLFREMRRKRAPMAIVVDEYGGTAGLVTVEDLLEEIVGPILDEYDVEEKPFEQVDAHTAVVDGRMSLEEVNEAMGLNLPTGEVDTVGGFVYALLGRVPQQGETVTVDDVALVVEKLEGRRIARVRITRKVPAGPLRP